MHPGREPAADSDGPHGASRRRTPAILRDATARRSAAAGVHAFTIASTGPQPTYTVSDGTRSACRRRSAWAFGVGKVGQTFLFERDGGLHEARVSYYDGPQRARRHAGPRLSRRRPAVEEAMARPVPPRGGAPLLRVSHDRADHGGRVSIRLAHPGRDLRSVSRSWPPARRCDDAPDPARRPPRTIMNPRRPRSRRLGRLLRRLSRDVLGREARWTSAVSPRCGRNPIDSRAAGAGAKAMLASPASPAMIRTSRSSGTRAPTTRSV